MNQCNYTIKKILHFYYNGFRNMPGWGRKVWLIILIKLFIMFAILKIFFFQDFLYKTYQTDAQRTEHVLNQITNYPDNYDRHH
jgi:hypothetical protein